jgi:hypothetical protein
MKRLLYAIIALVLIISVFGATCYASEEEIPTESTPVVDATTEENGENTPDTPENSFVAPERDFVGEVIAVVTNGEFWAIFGTTAVGALTIIIAVVSRFNEIVKGFSSIKDLIGGKATKEETADVIKKAVDGVTTTFEERYGELTGKYDELRANYSAQTAVLTLVALQLVKSPNARTEIMKILNNTEITAENVADIVETIQEEIKAADEAEPKPVTPALDAITEEVKADAAPFMILR